MAADDEKATSPGDVLRELFKEYGPCLILIDEWVAYARQLHDQSDLPAGGFETQFREQAEQARRHGDGHAVAVTVNQLLSRAIQLNLILAVFNMMPIPPLDGGNVLSGLLPRPLAVRFDQIRPRDIKTARRVADYIAGMTDRFALDEHARLFDPAVKP